MVATDCEEIDTLESADVSLNCGFHPGLVDKPELVTAFWTRQNIDGLENVAIEGKPLIQNYL